MSVINISRTHQYPVEELKMKIDDIKNDIMKKYDFFTEWESDQYLLFRRKGMNGSIEIDEHNIQLTLKLSIMYRMMKDQFKKEIVRVVDRHL